MDNPRPYQCFCSETEISYLQKLIEKVNQEKTYNIVKDNLPENRSTSVIIETMLVSYHINLKPMKEYIKILKLMNKREDFITLEG